MSKLLPPSARRARERLIQNLASSPFQAPIDPSSWDYGALISRGGRLNQLFGKDLEILALAGDMDALRVFIRTPFLDLPELNRLQGPLATRVFKAADAAILADLIHEWAAPNALGPSPKGPLVYSEMWGSCVAIALSRSGGDERVLLAAEAFYPIATTEGREEISAIIGGSLSGIEPADLIRLLFSSSSFIRSHSPEALPVFASRVQSHFRPWFAESPMVLIPTPPPSPEDFARARAYLSWLAQTPLPACDYPEPARIIRIISGFCRFPELAPAIAELLFSRQSTEGLTPHSDSSLRRFHAGESRSEGGAEIPWAARLISPVDQALLWGAVDSARALMRAGLPWAPEPFIKSARSAIQIASGPSEDILHHRVALAERLALERLDLPAPQSPGLRL